MIKSVGDQEIMKKRGFLQKFITALVLILVLIIMGIPSVNSMAATKKITLNKTSATLKIGDTLKLTLSNGGPSIQWSSDNKEIATVKNGLVTAKGVGVVQIKAVSNKMTASCKITVYQPAKKVTLNSEQNYIEVGDVFKVTAKFAPENATYQSLTWSVTNDYTWYPAVEQVSKNKFKAVSEGTATIVAYQKNTKKTYKLKVEVREVLGSFHIEASNKEVTSLEMFVGSHNIVQGVMDDEDFYWYDIDPEFKYSTADPKIATIDNRGQITALAKGSTSIRVTALNGKSFECRLKVNENRDSLAYDTFYADRIIDPVGLGNYTNWDNWSNADNTYIYQINNNRIGVFHRLSDKNGQYLKLYEYSEDFQYISEKSIELPYTEWGGFYQGEDGNYYAAVGQQNTEQDNSKIVFSIIKLNSDFEEVARCNISGAECSTRIPYDVGFARMTMDGSTLIVHTDRERYTSADGKNHQSNITLIIDTTIMRQNYVGALFPYNHVSHSMNQFVKMDGDNLIYVDHGDAYPRSVAMQTHYYFAATGWSDSYRNRPNTNSLDLLDIVGNIGENYTGVKVNGFEIGSNNNIVAGVSIPHDLIKADQLMTCGVKNVFVSVVSKNGTYAKLIWLTDYKEDGGISAENLRMVKIHDDKFALIYQINNEKTYNTGLIVIDSNGKVLSQKVFDFYFSSCVQPIYYNESLIWIDSDAEYSEEYYWDDIEDEQEKCRFVRILL